MIVGVGERHTLIGDVHLLLTDTEGRILFGRRAGTGYEDGAHHPPSGHLEAGESLVAALIREAKEEIGVTIDPDGVRFVHVMHNASSGGRVAFFFQVEDWQGEPSNREPDKCDQLAWFSPTELPDRMIPYCREALQHIAVGRQFSLFGW